MKPILLLLLFFFLKFPVLVNADPGICWVSPQEQEKEKSEVKERR